MKIVRTCPFTGKVNEREIAVTEAQLIDWEVKGTLIQDAMPYLSADDREFIISGITPEEWAKLFGEAE